MYKPQLNTQLAFEDFDQPMGLSMNPENRWIKKAAIIPWSELENGLTLVVNHDSTESWFTTLLFSGKVVSKLTCRCGLWRFDVVIKTGNFA